MTSFEHCSEAILHLHGDEPRCGLLEYGTMSDGVVYFGFRDGSAIFSNSKFRIVIPGPPKERRS